METNFKMETDFQQESYFLKYKEYHPQSMSTDSLQR